MGRGVEGGQNATNDAHAVRLFRETAEQGYAEAQYALGMMYGLGRGVEGGRNATNNAHGLEWLRKAAEQGFGLAKTCLSKAAEQGFASALKSMVEVACTVKEPPTKRRKRKGEKDA